MPDVLRFRGRIRRMKILPSLETRCKGAYKVWWSMIDRCTNPDSQSWKDYGGRGISVCDRWMIFENFVADMGNKPIGLSIDRIDNNGNYEKTNCRWATNKQQQVNRRVAKILTFNGQTKPASEWAKDYGMVYESLMTRLWRGWSIERALTTPVRKQCQRAS